jgi:hypothetical protein
MFCLQAVRRIPDSQQRQHNTAGKLSLPLFQDAHAVEDQPFSREGADVVSVIS